MRLSSAAETEAFGRAIAARLRIGDVVALEGDLGAGKTTLARGVVHGLGFEGEVTSPSFPIVQVYEEPAMRLPLWHVDLYRIEDPSELDELGLEDALTDAALVVEWPGRLPPDIAGDALFLQLQRAGEGARALTARVPPAWENRWPPQ